MINKVTIIGMGALGLMYGALMMENNPEIDLEYVMDTARAEKYKNTNFEINQKNYQFHVTSAEEAQAADLLIVAVKYTAMEDALNLMKNSIGLDTIIISVMNGISSERMIGERHSFDHLVYTVAQGMDAMKFGNRLTYTKSGELRLGIAGSGSRNKLERLIGFFDRIGLAYTVEQDIMQRMWSKFMLNVGINQTCMVYGQTYGQVLAEGESNRTFYAACREVLAVAEAEGVNLTEKDVAEYVEILRTLDPDGTPSMGQDRINKRPSEVDMFAGTVLELGRKHGICVPTNAYLLEKVKEIENGYH